MHLTRGALRDYLADRTVLVTGAGGSIGTELSRQLYALRPAHLVLVDISEHNLFALESQLSPASDRVSFCLANVQHTGAMAPIFEAHRPDVVLHAAAYKHVPLMERHPIAAFRNNTMATVRLLQQCAAYEVEQFVFASTDKAVEPVSVLGATKRLAEWAVRHSASPIRCKVVRFGNVFGSRGSVVPLFIQQFEAGGPLEVTHPEMERYFMSAEEASGLILQTLLLDTAPTYALQMGDPIRITWLAEQIIEHLAPGVSPSDHIMFTGRRPGEKLCEQLWGPDETSHATEHPRVLGLRGPIPVEPHALDALLTRLRGLSDESASGPLRSALLTPDPTAWLNAS
jgi:FlaA1/EpsC-like NDP-sugar epimerase